MTIETFTFVRYVDGKVCGLDCPHLGITRDTHCGLFREYMPMRDGRRTRCRGCMDRPALPTPLPNVVADFLLHDEDRP